MERHVSLREDDADRAESPPSLFEVAREGETLLITPVTDLGELKFQQIESGAIAILDSLNDPSVTNIILDFRRTDYFGTSALRFFLKLWKRVRDRNGQMAFCNVSDHEQELLQFTKLNRLWGICGSLAEAMQFVCGPAQTWR
jgi:anti-anti-sigma factor